MKNQYLLLTILVCFVSAYSFGQLSAKGKVNDWRAVAVTQHQKGNWLVGAGPTFLGVTAKAGRFVANRTWVGVQSEWNDFLSFRREAGAFARYYLWNGGGLSGFSEAGVSYGRFQAYNFNIDDPSPDAIYQTAKLNVAFGLECALSRRVTLEGVAKAGRLTVTNWIQPSLQGSINVYLGR